MDPGSVSELYDALFDFEAPRRGTSAYPIHKRLRWSEGRELDVYDWAADRLGLGSSDRVLDAGCGVGFGTIRLAERGVAHATGITVSRRELSFAQRASSRFANADAIDFRVGSFDSLPRQAFDAVIAVESLKHSTDLGVTLRAILDSLAPGGRGVIVEDVAVGRPPGVDAGTLLEDWRLATLYTEEDYTRELAARLERVEDLTSAVHRRGSLVRSAQLLGLNAALVWLRSTRAAAIRAFRGGVHLERLYAAGAMRYKAMFFSKGGRGTR